LADILKETLKLANKHGNKSALCRAAGVSWRSLYRITGSTGNPRLSSLLKLLAVLGYELQLVKLHQQGTQSEKNNSDTAIPTTP
jgi:DNA-binding phage protein